MKITVEYEINDDGNCEKCKKYYMQYKWQPGSDSFICVPFDSYLGKCSPKQCDKCKEFLSQQKAKIKCDDCKYFIYDLMESECTKGNENICGDTFSRNDWYYENCQDREE